MGKTDKDVPLFVHKARDDGAQYGWRRGIFSLAGYSTKEDRRIYNKSQRAKTKEGLHQVEQGDLDAAIAENVVDGRHRHCIDWDWW